MCEEMIGIDLYNQCLTGKVAKALTNKATDSDHIPCVLMVNSSGGVSQEPSMEVITKGKD